MPKSLLREKYRKSGDERLHALTTRLAAGGVAGRLAGLLRGNPTNIVVKMEDESWLVLVPAVRRDTHRFEVLQALTRRRVDAGALIRLQVGETGLHIVPPHDNSIRCAYAIGPEETFRRGGPPPIEPLALDGRPPPVIPLPPWDRPPPANPAQEPAPTAPAERKPTKRPSP